MSIARQVEVSLILLVSLLMAAALMPAVALAAPGAQEITVKVNGQPVALDVNPVLADGTVLVPLRGVLEQLGAVVDWCPTTGEAVITGNSHVVKVKPYSKTATVDDKTITMETEVMIVSGRVLVPLQFLSESMGVKVIWAPSANIVEILDLNKMTSEQRQLLAGFDSLKDVHQINQTRNDTIQATGADNQPIEITTQSTSRMAINNGDSHLWIETNYGDSPDVDQEPDTLEVIKKGGQLYARSGDDDWQDVDQDELDIPPVFAGGRDEQFLYYYNLPFTVHNNMEMGGQKVTEYSFIIDQKNIIDEAQELELPSAGANKDPDLLDTLAGITGGNGSKNIYLDSNNRIVLDDVTMDMVFQPPAADQDEGDQGEDQDLTGTTETINIDTNFDYTAKPEPIVAPTGVFPGA